MKYGFKDLLADIGMIVYFLFILILSPIIIICYLIGGILDLTYHDRHKDERDNDCPDYIDKGSF